MKTASRWSALVAVLLGLFSAIPLAAQGPRNYPSRPGEVILKLKHNTAPHDRDAILTDLGASDVTPLGSGGAERVRITRFGVDQAIARYRAHPKVQFIEPNYVYRTVTTPNDPEFSRLWGLQNTGQTGGIPGADIDATLAWDVFTGSDVLVAITDTGIDWTHPDLAANVFVNPGEIAGNGIDDDHNGFIDDVRGWDFVNHDNDPRDDHGHGTHVSGTVGAIGNNGIGVAGVNWHVKILPLKFLDAGGSGTTADAVTAIDYAVSMGARVISASWGGGGPSEALRLSIEAAGNAGVLFVAAAGNAGQNNDFFPNYPSNFDLPNIIAVAATDHFDRLASFSNYGATSVDLAAPGVDIFSTYPGGYTYLSGTSMATPHVTGALALIMGRYPDIGAADAKDLLLRSVDVLPSLAGQVATGGRLNAFTPIMVPDSIAPGAISNLHAVEPNGTWVMLTWTATGDDGAVGTASRYELRYSTAPITEANFGLAQLAPGAPHPAAAGSVEQMRASGLAFLTTYYFALKAFDEFGNASPLSNVVIATTLAPPDIGVSPSTLQADLLTGQSTTRVLTVANTGVADLNLTVGIDSPGPEATGTAGAPLVRTFAIPTATSPVSTDAAQSSSYPVTTAPYRGNQAAMRPPLGVDSIRITNILDGTRRILLLKTGDVSEIRTLLGGFPDIATVDEFDAATATPTLAQLLAYHAVIVAANFTFNDPVAAGNVLADYVDNGGGVILTIATFLSPWNIQGRFLTGGYSPFTIGSGPIGSAGLGSYDPTHPIMAGVTSALGFLLGDVDLSSGSELVASWTNGEPLVATKGPRVAAINIFVAATGYWAGDIPLMLHNAAFWSTAAPTWLSADPETLVVPPGGQMGVVVTFNAAGLDGGDYNGRVVMSSDDPDESEVSVPAQLHVTGAPDIALEGEPIVVESVADYATDGARTTHQLPVTVPPAGGGTLELVADGDYGDPTETATATAESTEVGAVGHVGSDCLPASGTFALSAARLGSLVADGVVEVSVQNSPDVNVFCPVNRHTVRLRYTNASDRLDFGSPFVGQSRQLGLTVRNIGSALLQVTSIASDQGEFTPGVSTLTLPPRATAPLVVTFHPGSAGAFAGTLTLQSNDPDRPTISIPMTGTGLNPPIVGAQPTSLTSTLLEGHAETQNLRILNSGLSPLEFTLRVRPSATSTQLSAFAGLSSGVGGASNNPPPVKPAVPPVTQASEPAFHAASAEFGLLRPSPAALTCVVGDPAAGLVYAQADQGAEFYRYRAETDTWERLADASLFSGNNGGAALLNGRIYTCYTQSPSVIGVYDIATNSWSMRSNPLTMGTGNIASDGSHYLYLDVASQMVRFDPTSGAVLALAPPPFYAEPWGGLQYLGGKLYAHQGNGQSGFATYDIATNTWMPLPPVPGGAVLGAAIDPSTREYCAYGSYFQNNLYRYSIDSGTWSVSTIPFFSVNDGGLVWLSGASVGVYFVQGESGTGFARLVEVPEFLTLDIASGVVPPLGSQDVGVRFDALDLIGGTYHARIDVLSNDPVTPVLGVPAAMTVIGVPRLALEGDPVLVESAANYTTDGARTTHRLAALVPPGVGGELELIAEGDYAYSFETATAIAESTTVGSVGGVGFSCAAAAGTFPLSAALLGTLAADGVVEVAVQNSPDVNVFCSVNRHTVRLRYTNPSDRLEFGSMFVGVSRELGLTVRNLGSAVLQLTSITSDRGEFTPGAASLAVPPRSSARLTVTFLPGSATVFAGTLTLLTNDPAQPQVQVAMHGQGLIPPDIAVAPTSLDASLFTGGLTTRTVAIDNTGGSDLRFTVAIENTLANALANTGASELSRQQVTLGKGEADSRRGDPVVDGKGGPDVFGHRWVDSDEPGGATFNWVEISGIGTAVPTSGDDWNYGPVPIGFTFPYSGHDFTAVHVCSNGWISFTSSSAQYSTYPLPSPFAPENQLAVFWADLYTPVGGVFYHNDGTRLIVEYRNVTYLGGGTPFTFEILLYPSGRIVYQYLNMGGTQTYASVGCQNATQDDGLNIAFNTPYVHDGLAIQIAAVPRWLSATPAAGTVPAGGHLDLEVRFDAAGMPGGDFDGDVAIASNDPDESLVTVLAHLHVTGAPDIELSRTALEYGTLFVGLARPETVVVHNAGTALLTVSGITASRPEFEVAPSVFNLAPGASQVVVVTFRPTAAGPDSATLTVQSNDPDEATLQVGLHGSGLIPPDIAVAPTSLNAALFTGGVTTQTLTLQNTGGSDLFFTLTPGGAPGDSVPRPPGATSGPDVQYSSGDPVSGGTHDVPVDTGPLVLAVPRPHANAGAVLVIADGGTQDDVSAVLGGAGYAVTQVVDDAIWDGTNPSPVGFVAVVLLDGVDYGDDMPLGGQQALMNYVSNGGGLIVTEWIGYEVENGRYASMRPLIPLTRTGGFTGFFTFDVIRAHPVTTGVSSSFSLATGLSSGYANSGTAVVTRRDDGSAAVVVKEFGVGRIVHFASAGNYDSRPFTVPDMQRLLVNAADWAGRGGWLGVNPSSGTIAAGGHLDLQVHFDATGLVGGDYDRNVVITSNDPDESEVLVPAHLHVTGAPDIALSRSALDFGELFVGAARPETVEVHNEGTDLLAVSAITASRADYQVDAAAGFTLPIGASRQVIVTFSPLGAGPAPGTLTVHSNDPDEAEVQVALTGSGLVPPDIALAPMAFAEDLLEGQTLTRPLRIANDGGSPLTVQLALRLPTVTVAAGTSGGSRRNDSTTVTPIGLADRSSYRERYRSGAGGGAMMASATPAPAVGTARTRVASAPPGAFVLFFDDMEGDSALWSHQATDSGSTDQWALSTARSSSGSRSWNVSQHAYQGSDALQSPAIDLGGVLDATLSFQHWYNFDDCGGDPNFEPDGGLVEISTDGGAHWQQIDPVGGYPYVLDDICSNPLANRNAYSHDSGGGAFVSSTFDLTPFVGHQVRLRFHAGWDCGNCEFNEGWYIDDVAVYAQGPTWLTVSPASATIDPHTTGVVNLAFDATGLAVGSHDAELVVRSNDPDEPTLVVPVNLQVADVGAVINVEPTTLNLGSRGNWMTVKLELPSPFDPAGIVVSTLRLNRVVPADSTRFMPGDEAVDGVPHLSLKFDQDLFKTTVEEGDEVRVVVTGEMEGNLRIMGAGTIQVTRPHVTSPNGGELLSPGSTTAIHWNVPESWPVDHADVYWSFNGGVSWSLITGGVHGTSLSWTVPTVVSHDALVRVVLFDALGELDHDSSDQPFSITTSPTAVEPPVADGAHQLLQNAPNPFGSATVTSIGFQLPRAAMVRLAIYDARGQLVRVVADGWMPAGRHDVTWEGLDRHGRPVAAGVYFYQLREGDVRLTKRMVVLR
jgi:hypothetical protein